MLPHFMTSVDTYDWAVRESSLGSLAAGIYIAGVLWRSCLMGFRVVKAEVSGDISASRKSLSHQCNVTSLYYSG